MTLLYNKLIPINQFHISFIKRTFKYHAFLFDWEANEGIQIKH